MSKRFKGTTRKLRQGRPPHARETTLGFIDENKVERKQGEGIFRVSERFRKKRADPVPFGNFATSCVVKRQKKRKLGGCQTPGESSRTQTMRSISWRARPLDQGEGVWKGGPTVISMSKTTRCRGRGGQAKRRESSGEELGVSDRKKAE